jgi:AAA+ ATPase superfamily predicted ATPase
MKEQLFIGREKEKEILNDALVSKESELIAVVGRRRVGKTFLINTVYENEIVFQLTGIQNIGVHQQLENFQRRLNKFEKAEDISYEKPKNWFDAFAQLEDFLEKQESDKKKVIFLDEVPWMASPKSDFLSAFGYFWNSWASLNNIIVVICGSATSWIVQKVVFDTGGLHNRITQYIQVEPFTLAEVEVYLKSRYLNFTRYQIIELYMAMGGIPHYLKEIKKGKSAVQNIDEICFSKLGLLRNEFSKLYPALFRFPEKYIAVIRTLATKKVGMTRNEIITKAKTANGGATSKILEELEQSSFITSYHAMNKKKKEKLFRLTDEYSLFYLHFMEDKSNEGRGTWQYLSQTQSYKTWSGYAFESICLKHIGQIKKALGIFGVYSKTASFVKKGTKTEKGTQIDLVIDRNDNVINLVEVKFYNKEFTLTKAYAAQLQQKKWIFENSTQTKKSTALTLITTFGIQQNEHSLGLIENVLTLDDLFERVPF